MGHDGTRRAPPRYPASWFALAEALREAAADPLGLMARLAATGEPVVAARLGPLRGWGVFDADLARQVLVSDEESYGRPAFVARADVSPELEAELARFAD